MNILKYFTLFVIVFSSFGSKPVTEKKNLTQLDNLFAGTVGSGNTFLDPGMPYGMVQLGYYSNYDKDMNADTIKGFSHTHVSEMASGGNTARGNVNFIPVILDKKQNYQSHFKHSDEKVNDGAILYLNGEEIIDNNGGHRAQRLDSKIGLKKGWLMINIDYFQQGLAKNLYVI